MRKPITSGISIELGWPSMAASAPIPPERVSAAEIVEQDGMIEYEIDFRKRVDFFRIAAQRLHGIAHGGKIDHSRHAREILHKHPCRSERNLALRRSFLKPFRKGADVACFNDPAVLMPQEILNQDL